MLSKRAWALAAAGALIAAAWLETAQNNPQIIGPFALTWLAETHPVSSWIALAAFSLLIAVTGRLIFSILAVSLSYATIAFASWTKIDYLEAPLTLADVRFFASNLAENIVLFRAYPNLGLMLVGAILLIVLTCILLFRVEARRGIRIRLVALAALVFLVGCGWMANSPSINAALPRMAVLGDDRSQANGHTQLHNFNVTKERRISDLLEIFFTDASAKFQPPEQVPQTRFKPAAAPHPPAVMPDIFAVLEESTFDPKILQACNGQAVCASALFKGSGAGREAGPLITHTTAGGTALSEFTFLTGLDWRIFGPGGALAPLSLASHMQATLPKHLQTLGYQTIAIYPVGRNFLNAREAYRYYGFEHFLGIEDLDLGSDWHALRDGQLFDKALGAIDKMRDGRPLFVFLLTIRNHGPHAEKHADLPQPVAPALAALPAPLADYLQRQQDSEDALNSLGKRWLESDRPRVLAWFGDHQPLFATKAKRAADYAASHFSQAPTDDQLRYATWYAMTSNRPTGLEREPASGAQGDSPLDIAYLGTRLLAFSGLPPRASDAATFQIQALCPLGIALCGDAQTVREYLSFRVWELQEIR